MHDCFGVARVELHGIVLHGSALSLQLLSDCSVVVRKPVCTTDDTTSKSAVVHACMRKGFREFALHGDSAQA